MRISNLELGARLELKRAELTGAKIEHARRNLDVLLKYATCSMADKASFSPLRDLMISDIIKNMKIMNDVNFIHK